MLILNELPTTVIADIVMNGLNPRLYINFVERLPPEICLKILGYLDPVSLIHVAMSYRGWYDLALDRKLWERLYYLEGWKAIPSEIMAAEQRMNETQVPSQKIESFEDGHANKKRAVSELTTQDDEDCDMVDADAAMAQESVTDQYNNLSHVRRPGESGSSVQSNASVTQHMGNLMMKSPSPLQDQRGQPTSRISKGKGKATIESLIETTPSLPSLPKSTLWIYDSIDRRYKINWKYLYTMRRRLELNWDRGRYTNFQLPHPDHLEEGHNECIYSLQYNQDYLVSGSRDRTLRIWNLRTRRLVRPPLRGHQGSVLCLQFDSDPEEDLIVSGSSDSDVILWKFSTGEIMQRLKTAHKESVLNVKFDKRILVTCSKDKTIKIFNRVPLRPGDLGYNGPQGVSPVPVNLRNYGFDDSPMNQAAIKPYTMIGCLEGHGAAVNAVQIYKREIVSASGDRHIKVWDWPNQTCQRTFIGHNKGIACVQYDGRRIVSGSSDNEVKVFDRETALEVASLRAHGNLVRTVQAGFGDLPYSIEQDRLEAKAVDQEYFKALNAGSLDQEVQSLRRRPHNAGSRRPEHITAYGAKLPPGGGGGPYGRIVSGSYDQTIIIWRRDKEGVWKSVHTLRQEEGAAAALRQTSSRFTSRVAPTLSTQLSNHNVLAPLSNAPRTTQAHPNFTHVEHPILATITPQTTSSYTQMIDTCVPQGPAALQQALASYPTMLTYQFHILSAISREPDPMVRSQLRQVVNNAVNRAQLAQNRIRESVQQALSATTTPGEMLTQSTSQNDAGSTSTVGHAATSNGGGPPSLTPHTQPQAQASASQVPVQIQGQRQHPHIPQADTSPARIFKLQFDARRIICCSQTSTIVGWDFCNGDPELEEASAFFGTVE
ncbi:WD40 repeat-like protein [Daldinia bambusicola]|nr:WD40 repeat-like protein [Daldinia bambusicola]